MIISAKKNAFTQEGTKAQFDKDLIVAFHTEDVASVLKANYEARKDANNGWSKDRHFRLIAKLTPLAAKMMEDHHPETKASDYKIRDKGWKKALMCAHCNTHAEGQWLQVPAGTI